MKRRALLKELERYGAHFPDEAARVLRFANFVGAHPDCFSRHCHPGHVTASAWIVSADHDSFLLTHHRKLGRWLQLGGHADGDSDVLRVALREAREESGMHDFEVVADSNDLLPLDLDVHRIAARGAEPEHDHYDVRFLLVAAKDPIIRVSDESHDVRWFTLGGAAELVAEESLRRLVRKTRARLAARTN